MRIFFSNHQDLLFICPKQVRKIVRSVLSSEKVKCDEISIFFVDTPTICELHERFFKDPSPTDCISLPMDDPYDQDSPYKILGEIFVCPETAIQYAKKNGLDAHQETTLYIVHGLLHLLGHDDIKREDQKKMREAEAFHIEKLKKKDFILGPLSC